jgi:hypothetical protein
MKNQESSDDSDFDSRNKVKVEKRLIKQQNQRDRDKKAYYDRCLPKLTKEEALAKIKKYALATEQRAYDRKERARRRLAGLPETDEESFKIFIEKLSSKIREMVLKKAELMKLSAENDMVVEDSH